MKKNVHPMVYDIQARCACGNLIEILSTSQSLDLDICSNCHPFFTGQQKFVDTAGRIEKFEKRYKNIKKK